MHLASMGAGSLNTADVEFGAAIGFTGRVAMPNSQWQFRPATLDHDAFSFGPCGRVLPQCPESRPAGPIRHAGPSNPLQSRRSGTFSGMAEVDSATLQEMAAVPLSMQYALDMEDHMGLSTAADGAPAPASVHLFPHYPPEAVSSATVAAHSLLQQFRGTGQFGGGAYAGKRMQ
jgi:hypothetical protein